MFHEGEESLGPLIMAAMAIAMRPMTQAVTTWVKVHFFFCMAM